MVEISFVATTSMVDAARSAGIPAAPSHDSLEPCPFAVGDFISYATAPGVAFRVTWRLYNHPVDKRKPPHWLVGLEQAKHPLEAVR
jgi:hypothetical protein